MNVRHPVEYMLNTCKGKIFLSLSRHIENSYSVGKRSTKKLVCSHFRAKQTSKSTISLCPKKRTGDGYLIPVENKNLSFIPEQRVSAGVWPRYTPYSKMAADLCGYTLVASFKIKYSFEF